MDFARTRWPSASSGDFFTFLLVTLVVLALLVFVFQYAWNGSVSNIFGLKNIGFIEAFFLLLVAKLLFSNNLNINQTC